jgi:LuxR family quorum sensing-dependent transcriptional regulator
VDSATISFDFLAAFQRAQSISQLLGQLQRAASNFGFLYVCLSGIPDALNTGGGQKGFVHTWPPGWFRIYRQRGYHRSDPIVRHLFSAVRPFTWADVPIDESDAKAVRVMEEAAQFGLHSGFCVPVIDIASRGLTAVSFGGASLGKLTEDDRGALHLIALFAHARACELYRRGKPTPSDGFRLTRREIEVLQWSAEGMTAREVADRLTISPETVEKHVTNICRRTGAANRTHAVAQALRNHLIN